MTTINNNTTTTISITDNQLLTNFILSLKKAGKSKEEIFEQLKLARQTLTKATEFPEVLSRKVMKYPVMLVANYGSKLLTTTSKVRDAMKEIGEDLPDLLEHFEQKEFNMFCRLVHLQVGVTLPAATNYLEWAQQMIAVSTRQHNGVAYKNPITGFPCNVRSFVVKSDLINYKVFGKRTSTKMRYKTEEVNHLKTTSSAVPTIIHSIDAGILDKTQERFNKPMALIHDSFGASPANMSSLHKSINESLLEVAESDVMQKIADELLVGCEDGIAKVQKKKGMDITKPPKANTFTGDLADTVLNSNYAFS